MFEVNGTQYELKMNTNRVKMVEAVTGKSIMGEWKQTDGLLSLQTVESCFQLPFGSYVQAPSASSQ